MMINYTTMARGVREYVDEVASTLTIESEARSCEFTRPMNAYLALREHVPTLPHWDLALHWHEYSGWAAVVETAPWGGPVAIAYLGGDVLADPGDVAKFVDDLLADRHPGSLLPRAVGGRSTLRSRLSRYAWQR